MRPIPKNLLPFGTPPVPRGYEILTDGAAKVYAKAPPDRRKSRRRVPAEPKVFVLAQDWSGKLFWREQAEVPTIGLRNFMIEQGLHTEILFPGMRLTGKAPKCSTILRQEFGMKGTPVSLYMQWCRFMGYTPDHLIARKAITEGELA